MKRSLTITLKPRVNTTYILPPKMFAMVEDVHLMAVNSGQMQYSMRVPEHLAYNLAKLIEKDDRVLGWQWLFANEHDEEAAVVDRDILDYQDGD